MAVTYSMYIQTFLKVDEDSKGLYVEVPGYSSDTFKVRCDESGLVPQVTHCRCSHYQHKGTCAHAEAAQSFWNRIYKSNIAKANEKALEQAMDASDLQEEIEEMVALTEQVEVVKGLEKFSTVIPAPVATSSKLAPKVVKKGNKLVAAKADYQSKRTASFFAGLPSRQKTEAA